MLLGAIFWYLNLSLGKWIFGGGMVILILGIRGFMVGIEKRQKFVVNKEKEPLTRGGPKSSKTHNKWDENSNHLQFKGIIDADPNNNHYRFGKGTEELYVDFKKKTNTWGSNKSKDNQSYYQNHNYKRK